VMWALTVQDKLVKTIIANYILWPGAHFINFRFVPSEHRILCVAAPLLPYGCDFWVCNQSVSRLSCLSCCGRQSSGPATTLSPDDASN
jgi:Mpv17 / PMP22 family